MRHTMVLMGAILAATPAASQSRDAQLATVLRTLEGGGHSVNFSSGRVLQDSYHAVTNVRAETPCRISFTQRRSSHELVPEDQRGTVSEQKRTLAKFMAVSARGDRVYYDFEGSSGQPFFWVTRSAGDAQALAAALIALAADCAQAEPLPVEEVVIDPAGRVAALAIDRREGSRYGWAIDHRTREEADARAMTECQRLGGNCQIVLRFTGGCGAYAVDQQRGSTAWGWGTDRERGPAESRAASEVTRRGGTLPATRVWGCNMRDPAAAADGRATAAAAAARVAAEQEAALQTRLAAANRLADLRREAMAVARAKSEAETRAYQQRIVDYQAAKAANDADVARAREAQAQYERQRAAYEESLRTGSYKNK